MTLSRRSFLRVGAASTAATLSPWFGRLATAAADDPKRKRACILLWMNGGPSQMETFDPKPNAPLEIRGEFRPIATSVPGLHFSELLPKTARIADRIAVIRSRRAQPAGQSRDDRLSLISTASMSLSN